MSKKKHKFDLTALVHHGYLTEGQTLCFVSDPSKKCRVAKQPNGEFKLDCGPKEGIKTVHAFAQQCLATEPPDHASRWLRTEEGKSGGSMPNKTLYELWQLDDSQSEAA